MKFSSALGISDCEYCKNKPICSVKDEYKKTVDEFNLFTLKYETYKRESLFFYYNLKCKYHIDNGEIF